VTVSPRTQIFEYLDGPRMVTALEDMRAGDLTPEQHRQLAACKDAVANAAPLPPLEYETRELTIEERLYRTAHDFRSWGCPEDEIGRDLAWKLIKLGHSVEDAEELLRSVGVTWSGSKAA
jgi:uncharacterized alpha-E superfamily protein